MGRALGIIALSALLGCGARVDAQGSGPGDGAVKLPKTDAAPLTAADAGAADATPEASAFQIPCGSTCPAGAFEVEWLGADGGVPSCACLPFSQADCVRVQDPATRTDCRCSFCGGETSLCTYDPYYGSLQQVVCNFP